MILIFLKNLRNDKSKKKKKKALTLKNTIILLNKSKNFLMILKVEYFQKENKHKEKDVQVF